VSRSHEFSVEADLENLKAVRSFIERAGGDLGVDETTLGDLCLVVDEAVTNIIVHGYQGGEGRIDLSVLQEGQDLVIRIVDDAPAFEAGDVEAPHLEQGLSQRKFGGMGVYLIRRMTDEATFTPLPGGGNELRLLKRHALPA
jgi:serine/threonine-protein kinase RsbW